MDLSGGCKSLMKTYDEELHTPVPRSYLGIAHQVIMKLDRPDIILFYIHEN